MAQSDIKWKLMVIMVLLLFMWTLYHVAKASQPDIVIDNSVTNNYYGDEGVETGITGGLSSTEIAELLTIGVAAGSHQFDYSTQEWQGSLTGAFYDGESAVSFGLGKRWDRFGKVLLHGNYTQKSGEDLWVVGGTFRF